MQVEIRPLREEDAHVSVRWRNISDIWRYTKFQATRPVTLDDELAWIRQVTADPTCRRFAILADGRYVGNIYLTGIKDGLAEYHVFIGEQDYWGRGVAKAATREILRFAGSRSIWTGSSCSSTRRTRPLCPCTRRSAGRQSPMKANSSGWSSFCPRTEREGASLLG